MSAFNDQPLLGIATNFLSLGSRAARPRRQKPLAHSASLPADRYAVRRISVLARNGSEEYLTVMPSVTLRAHYDGEHIVLDEPFEIPKNSPLAVVVLAPAELGHDQERPEWVSLNARSLVRAYGDDEPEYTPADLKP